MPPIQLSYLPDGKAGYLVDARLGEDEEGIILTMEIGGERQEYYLETSGAEEILRLIEEDKEEALRQIRQILRQDNPHYPH